ncbi:AIPR family protein [Aquibacillus salsiterrae]|uniref:AIPR family protein n=1 Tax=Aquibacillus salsiterrae TaxID=2950439 RepID=A0A9X4AEJ9_9BACI|nr:AIPR family protein [Aquibacillus salsiterrae]MDC3416664.1 AIPR family protein [Aquibacillus salsiterrae]
MDINKQIVDQRIRKIISDNEDWFVSEKDEKRKQAKAFVLLATASYLRVDLSEAITFLTEGGNDAGIDALFVGDPIDYEFPVTIFQGKYKFDLESDSNFPSNSLIRVLNTVNTIFDPSNEVKLNELLQPKVEEILSLISDGYIPNVKCIMVNNGLSWNDEGEHHIKNAGIPENQVVFEHYNHDDIVEHLKSKKEINDTITMVGKSIVEEFNFKRVLIGKVRVTDVAALMDRHGDDLLEKNIRKYLGLRKTRINESISETLTGEKRSNFYFFNNGITMVSDQFSHNALSAENWQVRVKDIQIINGGQTCKTIQETVNKHSDLDFSEAYVLLRLYELSGESHEELQYDITIATNSQNPVDLRDLRANEKIQRDLEIAINELGYSYKRKREGISSSVEAIPSSVAAEAIFSIWKHKPHLTKFRKNELFGKFYFDIFKDVNAAQLVIAVLIFRYCDSQRKKTSLLSNYPHISYSNYFLAMLMGEELLKKMNINLAQLTHKNFSSAKQILDQHKEDFYKLANQRLIKALNELYVEGYEKVELRRLSSTFRRGDLLVKLGY